MPATSKTEDLDLVDYAKAAADLLLEKHPGVVFTSGRRNAKQQASAMASNVVSNRKWIRDTYKDTPERAALQKWVDDHSGATSKSAIEAGLEGVMATWSDNQKRRLSRHFSGQAFDVQPVSGTAGKKIKETIRALPNLRISWRRKAAWSVGTPTSRRLDRQLEPSASKDQPAPPLRSSASDSRRS